VARVGLDKIRNRTKYDVRNNVEQVSREVNEDWIGLDKEQWRIKC
jgi:hypothetical protein